MFRLLHVLNNKIRKETSVYEIENNNRSPEHDAKLLTPANSERLDVARGL